MALQMQGQMHHDRQAAIGDVIGAAEHRQVASTEAGRAALASAISMGPAENPSPGEGGTIAKSMQPAMPRRLGAPLRGRSRRRFPGLGGPDQDEPLAGFEPV